MKIFELFEKQPLSEDRTFHAAINLCESVVRLLEGMNDDGGFDFEPDPAFAGVKGITRDTGTGNKEAKMAQQKQQGAKLNQTWQKLIQTLKTMNPQQAQTMKDNMKKVAKRAQELNFTLSPSPEQVLGL